MAFASNRAEPTDQSSLPSLGVWNYRRPLHLPSTRFSPASSLPASTAAESQRVQYLHMRRVASHRALAASGRTLYTLKPVFQGASTNLALGGRVTGLGLSSTQPSLVLPINSSVKVAAKSVRGSVGGVEKPNNQDTCFTIEASGWHFLGVCDGHGLFGHHVSGYLKAVLPRLLFDTLSLGGAEQAAEALKTAYALAVKGLKSTPVDCSNSGSTCVTVLWQGTSLVCGNVGDSRAVIGKRINGNWHHSDLSTDHKPDLPREKGRIEAAGGEVSVSKFTQLGPARVYLRNEPFPGLAMSRSIGDEVSKTVGVTADPDILQYTVSREDKFLILASDGVWEFISSLEAVKIVGLHWEQGEAGKACAALVRAAQLRWASCDNMVDDITAVIAFLNA